MFKRVRWIGMGAVAGVGASAWAQRRVRRTLDQHPTIKVGADVATTARQVGREVAAAVRDGRRAMAEREAALRADLASRSDPEQHTRIPGHPGVGGPRLHVVEASTTDLPRPRRPLGAGADARGGARPDQDRSGQDRSGQDRSGHPTAGPAPLHLQPAEPPVPPRPARRRRGS